MWEAENAIQHANSPVAEIRRLAAQSPSENVRQTLTTALDAADKSARQATSEPGREQHQQRGDRTAMPAQQPERARGGSGPVALTEEQQEWYKDQIRQAWQSHPARAEAVVGARRSRR